MVEKGCTIEFTLDGRPVLAQQNETIWDVAKREGIDIPHLCHSNKPSYRSDGNCRACMVEIEGERVLAASCIRHPLQGAIVHTASERTKKARKTVFEMLVTDQPPREEAYDKSSSFWLWAEKIGVSQSRFPRIESERTPTEDCSHVAMKVNLDACIQCNLCTRACRDVQVNDVIGLAHRGRESKIVFDFDDLMGSSSCVACGECVQACPTGALMPQSLVPSEVINDSSAVDDTIDTICPYCGVGCQISYAVKDNNIIFAKGRNGPSNENRLCVKGRFGFDYTTHKHRLKTPLIRKKGVPKNIGIDPGNPLEHFREATWDEALDLTAEGFRKLHQKHGGESIAGFGSAKCSNEEAYLFQKFIRVAFGHNNVDHCTRLCHASSVAALMESVGSGAVTAAFNEIKNADCAIIIGANSTENHPVAATYFKQFAKRGGTLIVMDPRRNGLSKYAKHVLQFRPGSDVALLNAIMNVIVTEGLTDDAYITKMTEDFDSFREHIKNYTPDSVSAICGISPDVIRTVARTFAKAPASMIFWGMGISQHTHGTDNARCLIALALMTGNIGKSGTGLHPLRGQNNVQGASDAGLIPMFLPDYQSVTQDNIREKFRKIWGVSINPTPGLTVVEIMDHAYQEKIRGMYILGENPAMSDPDLHHVRAAFEKLEHLVVQDIFVTETANYADVILPATTWLEKSGTATNTNRQVQMGRPVVSPPGEAKEDWWIITEIAKRLGLEWTYTHPRDVFSEMTECMGSLQNISWERLERSSSVTYPSLSPDDPGQSIVFKDAFPRLGGRARFVKAAIIPPNELPDDVYPLILTTGRQLEHWHTGSMTRRTKVLDSIEPAPSVTAHPKLLEKLNISAGNFVKIETRRGHITLTVRVDSAVSEDVLFIPFAYVEAAANILTNPALDPFGKIPEFKFSACRMESVDAVVS